MKFVYEWRSEVYKAYPQAQGVNVTEKYKWLAGKFLNGEEFYLSPLPECMPGEAVNEREFVESAKIKSTLFLPLKSGDLLLGSLLLNYIFSF